ncbi:uncharacterized protein EMH_0099820 [Eimeria mitis]|uniref:Uncharacterized protein n=1 Tax=Eimeria mitis TaxID=44415 RepID=U6KFW2_9EIME|nr:uncharacterized protein EMH_0099820 [Eimeria mitis]CDJ35686.1 hypothetical protein, conserved [Eimeria mitis]
MEAKHLRLETVVEETPLQPPPPPLDPGLDSLIDSVLFGIDDPFSEDVWLDDEQKLHSTADSSFLSIPSRSGSESASPVVEYTQEHSPTRLDPSLDPLIDSAFSGADDPSSEDSSLTDELMLQSPADASTESEPSALGSGPESPLVDSTKRGLDSPIDSAFSGAEDPSSGDFWLADETQKHPTADSSIGSKSSILGSGSESPVGESTEEPPPPPLDPGLDSLIDSVLSGAADPLSEDIWLDEETLLQPTADSSFGTSPSRSGSESESPVVESTQQPMPRHLDPALDSLIDSVLSRAEKRV